MPRTLPSLNAIKTFEAIVRHGTTLAAAAELGVTHGAVSRQIQLLERWVGRPLFDRQGGRLVVTSVGAVYAEVAGQALDLLHDATSKLLAISDGVVRISTTSSFASDWLMPRLPRFRSQHPQIDIWLEEEKDIVDPRSGGCDLAIRMGAGPWPGVAVTPLMNDRLVPVCTRRLAERLHQWDELLNVVLLHDGDEQAQWSRWFDRVGISAARARHLGKGSRFASSSLLLQASAAGQGVALVRERLAEPFFARGELVRPFAEAVDLGPAYWLVTRHDTEARRPLKAVLSWLQLEAATAHQGSTVSGS